MVVVVIVMVMVAVMSSGRGDRWCSDGGGKDGSAWQWPVVVDVTVIVGGGCW